MANYIQIDFEQASAVANAILKESQDLSERMSALDAKITGELTEVWKGAAADAFVNSYLDNLQKVLTTDAPNALNKLNENLNKNMSNFMEADQAGTGG